MGAKKEDVEKFLQGNPDFAKKYFAKKMTPATLSKVSGIPEKEIDFSQLQELSQVTFTAFTISVHVQSRAPEHLH